MPEIFEQNAFWVDDADDGTFEQNAEDEGILEVLEPEDVNRLEKMPTEKGVEMPFTSFPSHSDEPLVVEEEDSLDPEYWPVESSDYWANLEPPKEDGEPNEIIVEEEGEIIPGSDAKFVEEQKDDDKKVETDWAKDKDHTKFISYVLDKKNKIPKHSGETIPGCERAKSYLKSIDNEISSAMRSDLEGVIDEQQIDAVRKELENMVERLDRQINKLKKKTKKADINVRLVSEGQCEKCQSVVPMWNDVENDKLVCMHCEAEKEAPTDSDTLEKKANTPVINVYVTAFERAIVGTMINSAVSSGRDIEETYERLKNKYNFTPREELSIQQLVADYGYPVFKDRGLLNEPADPAAGDGVDWQTNYYA